MILGAEHIAPAGRQIAAFVFDGQGLKIQVVGPPDQLSSHSEEIGRMLSSIRQDGAGG